MAPTTTPTTTIRIRLPAEKAARLRECAAREHTTVSGLVSRIIDAYLARPTHGESAYEALKDIIRCCASTDGADARNAEKEWGEYVEQKHRRGRP